MDVLRPWLGLAVKCELDAVVQWRKSAAENPQSEAVGEVTYEDDGSNLRVASPHIGVVQIIEFQTYDEPIQAVISDSHTSIHVTFAASAVSKYTAVARKRITDGTRGGLIQIHAFEIVATHFGPKQSRLTLLIKEFQSLGSDGSGTFGNPLPIGSRQDITVTLSQLGEFRAQGPIGRKPQSDFGDDASASDIRSQAIDGPSDDETDGVAQAAYATQGTTPKDKSKGKSEICMASDGINKTNAIATDSPSRKSSVNLLPRRISLKSSHKALLDLFPPKNNLARVEMSNVATDLSLNEGVPRGSGQVDEGNNKASDRDNSAFRRSSAHNEPPGQVTATQPTQVKDAQSPRSVKGRFDEALQIPYLDPSKTQSFADGSGPTIHRSGIGLSNESANKDVMDHFERVLTPISDASPLKMDGDGNDAEEDPWKGMGRISRRDVTISRDQQALLDRQDSWLPPEPGHRGPVANVPIAVLQSLNASAERRATQVMPVEGNRPPPESPNSRGVREGTQNSISSEEESEEEQESDVLVSSSEWPPSSPPPLLIRNELPSDSSAASPDPTAARYMAEPTGIPGRGMLVPSRRGSNSSPHGGPTQFDASGSSPQPSPFPGQQHPKHDEGNVASMKGSLRGVVEQPSVPRNIGSSPQQQSWAHQLETAARGQASAVVSRDVTPSKRNAHLAGLSTEHSIDILSEDDEKSNSDDSLLETSVPLALDHQPNDADANSDTRTVSSHAFPSTVTPENMPVVQVKRTPNTNAQVSKQTTVQVESEALHITRGNDLLLESKQAKRVSNDAHSSDPVVPGTFDVQSVTLEDTASALLITGVADNHSVTFDEEALVNRQIQSEVDAQSLRSASVSPVKTETVFPDSSVVQPLPTFQAPGKSAIQVIPSKSPVKAVSDTKRKAEDYNVLSPNVTKRRKYYKVPSAFSFSQDHQEIQDPSTLARQQRREFFVSRKRSLLQSPTESSTKVHEEEVLEAKNLINGLSEASEEDEDVAMGLDHQEVEMDLSSEFSQTRDMASEPQPAAFETLEERNPLARQPNVPEPSVEVCKTAAIGNVRDHVIKASETGATVVSRAGSVYDRFRATYSEYTGDLKHFIAMAKKIDTLRTEDRMEHRSLWDDFIGRHKMEYRRYLSDCMEKADDPVSYERFYRDEIDEPQFTKKVVTPDNLADVLALASLTFRTEQLRRSDVEGQSASKGGSPAPVGHRSTASSDPGVIDLTADSQEHRTRAEPKISAPVQSAKKGPRPIPWVKPAIMSDISPPVRRKATPGSPGSSRSPPLPLSSQRSFKMPISASGSPLRPRSARSDVSPSVAERKEPVKPNNNRKSVKNGQLRTAQQDRSSVTDWLDRTSTHAAVKEGAPPSTADWWTDVNAPFKSFARAYASIESGKGNSFAKAEAQGYKKLGKIDSEGLVRPREKEVDVLSWKVEGSR